MENSSPEQQLFRDMTQMVEGFKIPLEQYRKGNQDPFIIDETPMGRPALRPPDRTSLLRKNTLQASWGDGEKAYLTVDSSGDEIRYSGTIYAPGFSVRMGAHSRVFDYLTLTQAVDPDDKLQSQLPKKFKIPRLHSSFEQTYGRDGRLKEVVLSSHLNGYTDLRLRVSELDKPSGPECLASEAQHVGDVVAQLALEKFDRGYHARLHEVSFPRKGDRSTAPLQHHRRVVFGEEGEIVEDITPDYVRQKIIEALRRTVPALETA